MSNSHLINANNHRAKEGARVLEDIARFVLRDTNLFHELRDIRHSIQVTAPIYDVYEDLGNHNFLEKNLHHNLIDIVKSNALRLQEALRVLEETSSMMTHKQHMKTLRYRVYDAHTKLYDLARKHLKRQSLEGLYLIIDPDIISYPMEQVIEVINQSSVNIVQYRNKSPSKKNVFQGAYFIKKNLAPTKVLIINDHIDIALDCAEGVHIGQEDYPLERIRNIIPNHFILGISTHHEAEARRAAEFDVSYIAVGCLFPTQSKQDVVPVSLQTLQTICKETSIPVCAIGGMTPYNLDQVLSANIRMVALISYVWKTKDPLKVIQDMHEKILHTIAES